jgi:benzoate-CoA ligase
MAAGLRGLGLRREERVLLLMLDGTDWPVSFLGAMYAGLVPVAVNTLLTADDYAYMLEHSRAQAVLVSGALLPALTAAMVKSDHEVQQGHRVAPGGAAAPGRGRVRGLPGRARAAGQAGGHRPDDPGFWLYSSGSTGRPRARCIRTPTPTGPASCTARRVLGLRETTSASRPPSCSSPTAWAMR